MQNLTDEWIAPLLGWYDNNKRPLPWRADREPYHVWISEIMLQQTRIEAVMRYYARFMAALPDVASLSRVDDDTLLKLWEGLGYYSRARNLKKAAQTVMSVYGGVFPQTYRELRTLPGIGDYTAGAIASICFDEKVPAVDGNVLRVLARLTADRENVLLPQVKKTRTEQLLAVMPARAGAFNEGLMELGEVLCLPNGTPLCGGCPLRDFCLAHRGGLTAELPVREKPAKRRTVALTVFLLQTPDGSIAVQKRPETGLLSGMYQLPNIEGHLPLEQLRAILTAWGLCFGDLTLCKRAKHVFTHIEWQMRCYSAAVERPEGDFLWVSDEELGSAYPLPTAFKKLL